MTTPNPCIDLCYTIIGQLTDTDNHIDGLQAQLAELENEGIFDLIPSESWESRRGSEAKYLGRYRSLVACRHTCFHRSLPLPRGVAATPAFIGRYRSLVACRHTCFHRSLPLPRGVAATPAFIGRYRSLVA